jgi:hypothetical protein
MFRHVRFRRCHKADSPNTSQVTIWATHFGTETVRFGHEGPGGPLPAARRPKTDTSDQVSRMMTSTKMMITKMPMIKPMMPLFTTASE